MVTSCLPKVKLLGAWMTHISGNKENKVVSIYKSHEQNIGIEKLIIQYILYAESQHIASLVVSELSSQFVDQGSDSVRITGGHL